MMYKGLEQSIQSFVPLSPQDVSKLVSAATILKLKKREHVLPGNGPCPLLVFVNKGVLRSFIKGANEEEHVLDLIFEREWCCDFNSITGVPASFSIEALEKSEIFVFHKEKIIPLLQENHGIGNYFRHFMIRQYVSVQQRLIEIQSASAESRYKNLIARHPHVIQKVPLIHIASYLGIRPESLSRIRKNVSQAG